MPFALSCTNKGCYKTQEPYIDPKTDKVYCSICDQEIANISYFTKVQMKSLKQVRKRKNASFSVKCVKCDKTERPKVVDDDIVCGVCDKPLDNLSLPFKNMLKEKLKTADKEI